MLHCMLFVLLCSDLLNTCKILVFHHCSALGHRDKCRTDGGLLEADKTAFLHLNHLKFLLSDMDGTDGLHSK